jgi:hypothetical protein
MSYPQAIRFVLEWERAAKFQTSLDTFGVAYVQVTEKSMEVLDPLKVLIDCGHGIQRCVGRYPEPEDLAKCRETVSAAENRVRWVSEWGPAWKVENLRESFEDYCKTRVVPDDLFRCAESSPIVAACLKAWRSGAISLEQAMFHAVKHLAEESVHLKKQMAELEALRIPEPIDHNGQRFVYAGPCPSCGQQIKSDLGAVHAKTDDV